MQSALVAFSATLAAAVTSLEVQGSQFVNPSTGDAFQIVGMAYQPGGSSGYDPSAGEDPLSDGAVCLRDAALMQVLGINTIRVYNLDPNLDHDECASVFNAAGMYMLIDVNSPLAGESLDSAAPADTYDASYLNRTFAVVEAFKSYDNLLGFFAGNEVISTVAQGATAPPYVRAVVRDLKNYIKKHATRTIPVGYSAADVRSVLEDTFNYFTCELEDDTDNMSQADMFALNSYSWCGNSSFTESGYNTLVSMFEDTAVPVFFSEFGCNDPAPRPFTEIGAIYSSEMDQTLSGGVVYEYSQEANDYGLVSIYSNATAQLVSDYDTLREKYAAIDWTTIQGVKASTTNKTASTCSSSLITESEFSSNWTLPTIPTAAEKIITDGVSPLPSGKIVTISDLTVSQKVYDADGNVISGLSVVQLSSTAFNEYGTNNMTASSSTTSTSTSSSASASTTKKSAAYRPAAAASVALIPAFAVLLMAGY
jgi:1,3-beta-glucanosyltransferase GAS3